MAQQHTHIIMHGLLVILQEFLHQVMHIVIDAGTANISANTDCNTLTVNPGAALTIDSGVTVTATTVDLNSTSQLVSSLIIRWHNYRNRKI